MMRMHFSRAGANLVRALIARAGAPTDSVRLVSYRAMEWRSLTFDGERHEIRLRLAGPGCEELRARLLDGLGEHEFDLGEDIVADIGGHRTSGEAGGVIELMVEALTVSA